MVTVLGDDVEPTGTCPKSSAAGRAVMSTPVPTMGSSCGCTDCPCCVTAFKFMNPAAVPAAVGAKVALTFVAPGALKVDGLTVKAPLVKLRLKVRGVAGKIVNVWEEEHPRRTFPKLNELGEKVNARSPVPLTATFCDVV